jgi:hypothetical protein
MITNNGKQIIAKFLLGQAPDFATHIAGGCGRVPFYPNQTITVAETNSQKIRKSLEFETFRVPIIARGIIKEDGQDKIVLKAEAPTEQRYLLSEVGFFSAPNNVTAGSYDSKTLNTFTSNESWSIASINSSSAISTIDGDSLYNSSNNIITTSRAFFINSSSDLFLNSNRKDRREPIRFYNQALAVSGSSSYISPSFTTSSASYWVENSSFAMNLSQNQPTDQIKLAISVISKVASNNTNPSKVRIVLEFVNNLPGLQLTSPKARMTAELSASDFVVLNTGQPSDPTSRYIIINKSLGDFSKDDTFSWANVNLIRIYGCVVDGSENPLDTYYIAYDGMRFENISTENPLFSLVGYNIMRNDSAYPLLKAANTTNFIEYRFGIGVT